MVLYLEKVLSIFDLYFHREKVIYKNIITYEYNVEIATCVCVYIT